MSFLRNLKNNIKDLFRYPVMKNKDDSYNLYWQNRSNEFMNDFQRDRAVLIRNIISKDESILDIGCGNGVILEYLKKNGHNGKLYGVDSSDFAIEEGLKKGFEFKKIDIRNKFELDQLSEVENILFLEVLEHMSDAEEILSWAINKATKRVIFSVPNTGYIFHRFRLLFGKFPLQWRSHPSEHLRFWTITDMKWWLTSQNIKNYKIIGYQGLPFLNKIWRNLFSGGIFVVIERK